MFPFDDVIMSSKLAQKLSQSNEITTDINDSNFVNHLYVDWPVAKQQYICFKHSYRGTSFTTKNNIEHGRLITRNQFIKNVV